MNNSFILTIVLWKTRNWRHAKTVGELCKNFGLCLLTKDCYIGKLKAREQNNMRKILASIFVGKTEVYHMMSLCKSCYESASFYEYQRKILEDVSFEIV